MIDFIGKKLLKKQQQFLHQTSVYKEVAVVSQNGNYIKLSDNSEYDFINAFSSKKLKSPDNDFQQMIIAEISEYESKLKEKKDAEKSAHQSKLILELKKIQSLDQGELIPKNISSHCGSITRDKELKHLYSYGEVARIIYDECHTVFKFKTSGAFDKRQLLFDENCSPEGYDVWMLPHSNINNSTNKVWWNFVEGDTITQYQKHSNFTSSKAPRITFVKQKDMQYVFMGIYVKKETYQIKDNGQIYYAYVFERAELDYE